MSRKWGASDNLMRRGPMTSRPHRFRLGLVAFGFVSVALLVLSRLEHDYVKHLRWQMTEPVAPILAKAGAPLDEMRRMGRTLSGAFDAAAEIERLKQENQRLRGWEWRAIEAERKLEEMSQLSNLVRDKAMPFVTCRVVAHSVGPFVQSALVNAGEEHGIKTGYPAVSGDGLVGRVVEAGKGASQVLLLTDLNSRIPVHIGGGAVRAVMAGDNGSRPRIEYLAPEMSIVAGDEVSTSGVGGLFPRGLRIGTVVKDGPGWRVAPYAGLDRIEFLSVLFYDTPTLGLIEQAGAIKGAQLGSGGRPARPGNAP